MSETTTKSGTTERERDIMLAVRVLGWSRANENAPEEWPHGRKVTLKPPGGEGHRCFYDHGNGKFNTESMSMHPYVSVPEFHTDSDAMLTLLDALEGKGCRYALSNRRRGMKACSIWVGVGVKLRSVTRKAKTLPAAVAAAALAALSDKE